MKPLRIDWRRVMVDLEEIGLNPRSVAVRIGRSRVWVMDLRSGKIQDPRLVYGCRLLRLWADAMRLTMDKAPKVNRG